MKLSLLVVAALLALASGRVEKSVSQPGAGEQPQRGQKVSVHYTGTLLDGTEFDSSRTRGEQFKFTLGAGEVIPCWDEAVASMRIGERATVTCSSDTAYGSRGAGGLIPPNADLKFDVELFGAQF